jgi:hypothetical protein
MFDKDASGKSNCNGGCAAAWPPFAVTNAALADGDFSIVKRDDGTSQWAFKGMPLYFFAGDAKAGDTNGDNQGGRVARASRRVEEDIGRTEHQLQRGLQILTEVIASGLQGSDASNVRASCAIVALTARKRYFVEGPATAGYRTLRCSWTLTNCADHHVRHVASLV